MKRVYEAGDGLEAHMLAGLLEQSGSVAQVRGDMLQGAVGELPASGLASGWVNEDDEARSLEVIADYEASQPPPSGPTLRERIREPGRAETDSTRAFRKGLLIGMFLGAALMAWLL